MLVEEISKRVNKFDVVQKNFFIEIVQRLRNRELRSLEQQYKDIEELNDLCKLEILNAVKELEKLNKEGKNFTIKEKHELFNNVLIRTFELQDDKVISIINELDILVLKFYLKTIVRIWIIPSPFLLSLKARKNILVK